MDADFTICRTISLPAHRLEAWMENFATRHGYLSTAVDRALHLQSPNGARASISLPWRNERYLSTVEDFVSAACRPRHFGILLARKDAASIGIVHGEKVLAHRTSTYYVQGRTKAGGWSQQRYARRRANQAKSASDSIIADCLEIFSQGIVEQIVCGGDRKTIEAILKDDRLERLYPLYRRQLINIKTPRYATLLEVASRAYDLTIALNDEAVHSDKNSQNLETSTYRCDKVTQ